MENGVGSKAGVRVGDRVLTVDDHPVMSRLECNTLVAKSGGNPFDLAVERKIASPGSASRLTSRPTLVPVSRFRVSARILDAKSAFSRNRELLGRVLLVLEHRLDKMPTRSVRSDSLDRKLMSSCVFV